MAAEMSVTGNPPSRMEKLLSEIDELRSSMRLQPLREVSEADGVRREREGTTSSSRTFAPNVVNPVSGGYLSEDPFSEDSIIFSCPPPSMDFPCQADGRRAETQTERPESARLDVDSGGACFVPFPVDGDLSKPRGSWLGPAPFDYEDILPIETSMGKVDRADLFGQPDPFGQPDSLLDITSSSKGENEAREDCVNLPGTVDEYKEAINLEPVKDPMRKDPALVAQDLPVVEKGVEEEVTAEPEDGAFAEQACDPQGLSQEEGQTFQEFAKDVAEDLPVVEKGVEEEVTAEPEDRASAEQACDEHTPANQIVEGLSQEEGQTFQEFAKDVADDLPVVERGVEEEVTSEPEDRASAEQAQVQEDQVNCRGSGQADVEGNKDLQERVEGLEKLVQDLQASLKAKDRALQNWEDKFQVMPRESDQEKLEKPKSNPDITEELATLRHRDVTQKELLGRLQSKLEVQSQKAAECEAALEEANTMEKKDFGALLASLQTKMRELKVQKADTAALMKPWASDTDGAQSGPDVRPDATDTQDLPPVPMMVSRNSANATEQASGAMGAMYDAQAAQVPQDPKLVAVIGGRLQAAPFQSPSLIPQSPREPVTPLGARQDSEAPLAKPQTFQVLRRPGCAPRIASPTWSRQSSPSMTSLVSGATPDLRRNARSPSPQPILLPAASTGSRSRYSRSPSPARPFVWTQPPLTPRKGSPAGSISAGPPPGAFVWGAKIQAEGPAVAALWQPPRLQSPPPREETPSKQRPMFPAQRPPTPQVPQVAHGPRQRPEGPLVPQPQRRTNQVVTPLRRMPAQVLPMQCQLQAPQSPQSPHLQSLRTVLTTPTPTPVQTPRQIQPSSFTPMQYHRQMPVAQPVPMCFGFAMPPATPSSRPLHSPPQALVQELQATPTFSGESIEQQHKQASEATSISDPKASDKQSEERQPTVRALAWERMAPRRGPHIQPI